MDFEWDEEKAHANVFKHGLSFARAAKAFSDPNALDEPDDRFDYGEERRRLTGWAADRLVTVIYAQRGSRIRLISARKATARERRRYDTGANDTG